jgi:hypothetical protein
MTRGPKQVILICCYRDPDTDEMCNVQVKAQQDRETGAIEAWLKLPRFWPSWPLNIEVNLMSGGDDE